MIKLESKLILYFSTFSLILFYVHFFHQTTHIFIFILFFMVLFQTLSINLECIKTLIFIKSTTRLSNTLTLIFFNQFPKQFQISFNP